jgi:prepilin-type processing-associated H-X9-DG protein
LTFRLKSGKPVANILFADSANVNVSGSY